MSAVLIDENEPVVPVEEGDEFMPTFESPATAPPVAATGIMWPSIAWEQSLLESARHPALPTVIDSFVEEKYEYLVEEIPAGQGLWDVWTEGDAGETTSSRSPRSQYTRAGSRATGATQRAGGVPRPGIEPAA